MCFEMPFSQVVLDNDVLKLGPANCWKGTLPWGVLASETFSLKIFTKQILNPRQFLCAMHGHATVQLNANYLWCQSFSQPAPDKGTKQGAGRRSQQCCSLDLICDTVSHIALVTIEARAPKHPLFVGHHLSAHNKRRINCKSKNNRFP